jgi:transposase
MTNDRRRWFAGVDWASQKHDVAITDGDGQTLGRKTVEHSGAGLTQMAEWLVATTGAEPADIHVAIEVPHGPVVDTLLERGFCVYSINPKQVDRFRDRFTLAGAKDDSRDTDVLASALRTDTHCFRELAPLDPSIAALREWSRIADDHGKDLRRYINRLRDQLQRSFPAFLKLDGDLAMGWKLELLELAPTPAKAARLREATIAKILKRHRIRCHDAAGVVAILREPAVGLSKAAAEASAVHIEVLLPSIQLALHQLKEARTKLDRLTAALAAPSINENEEDDDVPGQVMGQRDAAILRSLPGMGRVNLATLLSEAPDAVRNRDYRALRCQAGIAPVTRQSGKSKRVVQRYACNGRLNNAMHHWASVAIQRDLASRAKYQALRARGHSYARALRGVADRLLYIACAMLKTGTLYDAELSHAKSA